MEAKAIEVHRIYGIYIYILYPVIVVILEV